MNLAPLRPNPRYSEKQRLDFLDAMKPKNDTEAVPLSKLQFALDKDGNGSITRDEWIQDLTDLHQGEKGAEQPLYLGKKPGFFGELLGKEPKFQKADGWIEVPDSGPVRYDTKVLRSINLADQTAEIATVYTIPFLREALYV